MSDAIGRRPDGVTCMDWEKPSPEGRACLSYRTGGWCTLQPRSLGTSRPGLRQLSACTEYLKKNQPPPVNDSCFVVYPSANTIARSEAPQGLPDAKAPPGAQAPPRTAPGSQPPRPGLFGPPRVGSAARRAQDALARTRPDGGPGADPPAPVVSLAPDDDPAEELLRKRVAELEAMAEEIHLTTDYGPVVLVRARTAAGASATNPTGRRELTFRESALLSFALAVLPGSRVTAFRGPLAGELEVATQVLPLALAAEFDSAAVCAACHEAPVQLAVGGGTSADFCSACIAMQTYAHARGTHCGLTGTPDRECLAGYEDGRCECPGCPSVGSSVGVGDGDLKTGKESVSSTDGWDEI